VCYCYCNTKSSTTTSYQSTSNSCRNYGKTVPVRLCQLSIVHRPLPCRSSGTQCRCEDCLQSELCWSYITTYQPVSILFSQSFCINLRDEVELCVSCNSHFSKCQTLRADRRAVNMNLYINNTTKRISSTRSFQ